MRSTSGRYSSYWNVFLLFCIIVMYKASSDTLKIPQMSLNNAILLTQPHYGVSVEFAISWSIGCSLQEREGHLPERRSSRPGIFSHQPWQKRGSRPRHRRYDYRLPNLDLHKVFTVFESIFSIAFLFQDTQFKVSGVYFDGSGSEQARVSTRSSVKRFEKHDQ